ncbi:MAG: thiamine phosphate synthase [Prevotellaceae bacterium]|jgi:thiamine-phosphate pyrophosphorylase|nr:thiamine phosphate synthase [Prevotellaceae bacterium]
MKKTLHPSLIGFHSPLVITSPFFLPNEAEDIIALLDAGLEVLHLRKPDATKHEYEWLLNSIPRKYHKKMMLHDFFELAEKYDVRGVHLNRRNPAYNGTKNLRISKSCHSIPELGKIDRYDYVFLSPIFNSISKTGYTSPFSHEELRKASDSGLINEKVIALGGIDADTLPLLKPYKFGGTAVLGAIWNISLSPSAEKNSKKIVEGFLAIRRSCQN